MKKLAFALAAASALISAPAVGADLRRPAARAPVVAAAPYYNWSGFYIGGHVGGAWGEEITTIVAAPGILAPGTSFTANERGFIGGGQVGFNYQAGSFVVGAEVDWSWSGANATNSIPSLIPGVTVDTSADINWLATATARVGVAFSNVLLYAKGGAAWMDVDYTAAAVAGGAVLIGPAAISDTRVGWTVGAGVEFGLGQNWSAKLEYGYLDFGTERYTFAAPGVAATADIDSTVHVVKGGINYRFNWGGPVVASY